MSYLSCQKNNVKILYSLGFLVGILTSFLFFSNVRALNCGDYNSYEEGCKQYPNVCSWGGLGCSSIVDSSQTVQKWCICNKNDRDCLPDKYNTDVLCGIKILDDNILDSFCVPTTDIGQCPTVTTDIRFCACLDDKTSCQDTLYDFKPNCEQSVKNTKYSCLTVKKGVSCDSLIIKQTQSSSVQNSNNVDIKSSFPDISGLNPLRTTSVTTLFGRGISILLGVLGSLAIVIFMYGGFMWMISMGNSERADKGLKTLLWGAMGVFVIFASYAAVTFVLDAFK